MKYETDLNMWLKQKKHIYVITVFKAFQLHTASLSLMCQIILALSHTKEDMIMWSEGDGSRGKWGRGGGGHNTDVDRKDGGENKELKSVR